MEKGFDMKMMGMFGVSKDVKVVNHPTGSPQNPSKWSRLAMTLNPTSTERDVEDVKDKMFTKVFSSPSIQTDEGTRSGWVVLQVALVVAMRILSQWLP